MNRLLAAMALAAAFVGAPAFATDVGVSVTISQPGVYGRVDIGRFPQPQVILPQPVIIGRPVVVQPEPVYLWVPPGHRANWRHHCHRYRACGVPVYFVRHDWYEQHVHRRGRHDDRHDGRHDDRRRGDERGRGHGRGHDRRD